MQRDLAAYEMGVKEARRDIAAGRLRYFSGATSGAAWGNDLAGTLHSNFKIEVTFVSDIVDSQSVSFEEGYNAMIEQHVEKLYGEGSLAQTLAEVQRRRKQKYDEWVASELKK